MEQRDSDSAASRRSFLGTAAAIAGGAWLVPGFGSSRVAAQSAPTAGPATPARSLRFAHLTDIHVQPERNAEAGMAAAFTHAQEQGAELIVTGGDAVMDVFGAQRPRTDQLKGVWSNRIKQDCSRPLLHTVGNHDIHGWNQKSSKTSGQEADFGKQFSRELFGIPSTYYAADRAGWRFIILDSTQRKDDGYVGHCDDAQLAWLKQTLAETSKSTPIVVVSHIPILSLVALTYWDAKDRSKLNEDTVIPAGEMHTDGVELHKLFAAHGGVKLCLSGHVHLLDRCTLDGVTYICDGAVCGGWWKGSCQGIPEGYGLVDLNADGSFEHRYTTYGWKADPA